MKPLSLQDVRGAVSGKGLTPLPDTFGPILNICTDTRAMSPSSVFVALKGDTFDGSQFLAQAADPKPGPRRQLPDTRPRIHSLHDSSAVDSPRRFNQTEGRRSGT